MEKYCEQCKIKFNAKRKKQKFCSTECQYQSYRKLKIKRIERTCVFCDNIFYTKQSDIDQGKGKYCSRKCKDTNQKESYKGENNPTWGRKSTENEKLIRSSIIKEIWKSQEFRDSVRKGIELFVIENNYHPGWGEKSKENRKKTNLERYGVEHNWSGVYGTRKSDLTTLKKYGKDSVRFLMDNLPMKLNTKPEKIFKQILEDLNIEYKPQFELYYTETKYKIYDFLLIKKNILIEIDGDYWHSNPIKYKILNEEQKINRINDVFKNELSNQKGFQIYRFWESDLKNNINDVIKVIKKIYE